MTRNSRLRLDPITHLPTVNSFGELSEFLRGAVADEESRQFSDSMTLLASHVEAIVAALRLDKRRARIAPLLMDLLTVLRQHRQLVIGLSPAWRGLYEYAGYLNALNNLRVLIGQWLLDGARDPADAALIGLEADDFQRVAWRTLGEGMLMIDMYEQLVAGLGDDGAPPSALGKLEEPNVQRAMAWWKKLGL